MATSLEVRRQFVSDLRRLLKEGHHTSTTIAAACGVVPRTVQYWLRQGTCNASADRLREFRVSLQMTKERHSKLSARMVSLLAGAIADVAQSRASNGDVSGRAAGLASVGKIVSDILRRQMVPHRLVVDCNNYPVTTAEIWFDQPNFLPTAWRLVLIDGKPNIVYELSEPDKNGQPRLQYGDFHQTILEQVVKKVLQLAKSHQLSQRQHCAQELKDRMLKTIIQRQ